MPLVKMSDYMQNASIKELDAKDFLPDEVLRIIEADMKEMRDLAVEIRNDADEEDDSLQPGVLKDQRKDEERHAQEHSHTRDDVDKMFNFRSDGSLAPLQPRSQRGNSAHHGSIPSIHDNATCSALKKSTGNCTRFYQ